MKQNKSSIATKAALLLGLLMTAVSALAQQVAGTVTHLSGPLLARKADGTVKILSQASVVEQGDTLVSEKNTYARIKFTDNSEITLRPGSQFKIESFAFDEAQPDKDSAVFSLVKGGLRAVTGMLGKRNREKFGLNTPTATVGIRGTIFVVEYVAPPTESGVASYAQASVAALAYDITDPGIRSDLPGVVAPSDFLRPPADSTQLAQNENGEQPRPDSGMMPPPAAETDSRSPGLYVQVIDGMIHVTNSGGSQNFAAGQFGFTPNFNVPPVLLPQNPGMRFTPPPAFSVSTGPQTGQLVSRVSREVNCEIR